MVILKDEEKSKIVNQEFISFRNNPNQGFTTSFFILRLIEVRFIRLNRYRNHRSQTSERYRVVGDRSSQNFLSRALLKLNLEWIPWNNLGGLFTLRLEFCLLIDDWASWIDDHIPWWKSFVNSYFKREFHSMSSFPDVKSGTYCQTCSRNCVPC